ncbi:putative GNAT family N-acetyltransferase [Podospora conica]|nr:putative GNAT family N-acetyltransferase [Schizothecium conicum]
MPPYLQIPPPPSLPEGYTLTPGLPPVPSYLHLRATSGLTPVTASQAAPLAANSYYGCYITHTPSKEYVAMGRIIADGGWYFLIADIATLPEHRRQGLGDAVVKHLLAYIARNAPADGEPYVTLFADEMGRGLYRRNGFVEAMGVGEMGMCLPEGWREEAIYRLSMLPSRGNV